MHGAPFPADRPERIPALPGLRDLARPVLNLPCIQGKGAAYFL